MVARLGKAHGRSAVGRMHDIGHQPAVGRGHQTTIEAGDLLARGTGTFQIGRCEVRAQPGQFQVGIASRKRKERGQPFGLDAQTVHTRVDLHVHRPALLQPACRLRLAALRPAPPRRGAEPLQLADVVDDRRETFFQHLGVGVTIVGT